MTPETLAEAILQAAGSNLHRYAQKNRRAIIAAAARIIEDIELNAICDERAAGKGIPVSLDAMDVAADPRNIAQDGRDGSVGSTPSQTVDNGPHGAENGGLK